MSARRILFGANAVVAVFFLYGIVQALIIQGFSLSAWSVFYYASVGFSLSVSVANMWALSRWSAE